MKIPMLRRGMIVACLLLCCAACTAQKTRPLDVRAAEPVTVTTQEYAQITGNLLDPVEPAISFTDVWTNGDMHNALAHDARWLDTCKAQVDGIRALYEKQAKTKALAKP